MKKSSTISLFLGALAAVVCLSPASQVHAFGGPPGGPFSNGSYFPNDGTFSAVVRGENLSGTVQFSTSSGGDGGAGSTGVSTIYYDGDTFIGNAQGVYNPEASTMTVNFQSDSEGQGQNDYQISDAAGTQTKEVSYFDGLYISGYANCKTSNAFPNQKFSGKGQAELQFLDFLPNNNKTLYLPEVSQENVPISISGVRLSNTATTFATSTVRPPSVTEVSVLE